jgi:predicted alpha/beta superfamily hydrolase
MQDITCVPVPIFDTALHMLERTVAVRPYTLSVWLPPHYVETSASYSVVYLLDANTLLPWRPQPHVR